MKVNTHPTYLGVANKLIHMIDKQGGSYLGNGNVQLIFSCQFHEWFGTLGNTCSDDKGNEWYYN